ncbi:MAG TPA: hypothetical protein VGF48_17620 [Thermoanaerobaculia bacterium]|jgi:hypothetical protein
MRDLSTLSLPFSLTLSGVRSIFFALLLSTLPLLAEQPIAPVANGPAYGWQRAVAIGANGRGETFVVWQDVRDGGYAKLTGSRVTETGELLDPFGIVVGPMTSFPTSVRVIGDGDGWLVEYELTYAGTRQQHRVDANGAITAAVPLAPPARFTHALLGSSNIVRASNGSETLLVGRRAPHEAAQLVTFRLNAAGELIGEPVVFAPLAVYRGALLNLLWTGEDWVLLLRHANEVRAQRIDRNGAPSGNVITLAADALYNNEMPATTHGDGSIAVLYRSTSFDLIRIARLAGTTATHSEPIASDEAAIAATPGGYMLARTVSNGVVVAPISRDLVLLDQENIEETLSANAQKGFATDRSSEARLLVWYEEDGMQRGRLMARRPEVAEKFALLPSERDQRAPAVARVGDSHFVVWYERDTAAQRQSVKGMLFDYLNEPLLHEPVTIGSAPLTLPSPSSGYEPFPIEPVPAVVWSGHYFLVAWSSGIFLRLTSVTAGGVVVHHAPVSTRFAAPQSRPVLVRAGSTIYVVWQSGDIEERCPFLCIGYPARIHAMRFDLAGQRIDTTPMFVATDALSARPDAAWNGHSLLVTFIRNGKLYARELYPFYLGDERLIAEHATTGSVIAENGEFVIVANAKLWRDAQGVRTAVERPVDGVPRIFLD